MFNGEEWTKKNKKVRYWAVSTDASWMKMDKDPTFETEKFVVC